MNMIEKVAKEIYERQFEGVDFDSLGERSIERHLQIEVARAALEAMMEPSNQMLEDAGAMETVYPRDDADRIHIEWWQAMIKAALEEE